MQSNVTQKWGIKVADREPIDTLDQNRWTDAVVNVITIGEPERLVR